MNEPYRTYQVGASGPDVHHDTLLSNVAVVAFDDGTDGLIGNDLFPSVPVNKQSNRYAIIDKGNFLRIPDARRAPGAEARRVEFQVSSDAYFADNFALAAEIPLEDLANADTVFQLRENSTRLVVGNLRRAQEKRIADIVTSATNLGSGTTLSGNSLWSDFVNSNPLGDVTTAHAFIRQQTGLVANTAMIDEDTFQIVRRHPDLLDMFKYTSGGELNEDQIKSVFRVKKLLIGSAVQENALEGGTTSMTNIWGNNCLIAFVGPSTGMRSQTLGLRFVWPAPGFPAPLAAHTRREAGAGTKNVEYIQAEHYQDEKLIATDLGYLIATTL